MILPHHVVLCYNHDMKTRHNKAKYESKKTEYLMRGKLRKCSQPGDFTFVSSDSAYTILHNGTEIGSFSLLPYSDGKTVYFYAYKINDELKGHGLGTEIFRTIKHFLREQGYSEIVLQVSRSNEAAYHLYKNNVLRITEAV